VAVKIARRRLRMDGMFLFVTLFAGVGGFALVGSYADHQPIETFNQGNYALSHYTTKTSGSYLLGLNKQWSYCLNASAANATVMVVDSGAPKRFALVPSAEGESCFRTDADYSRATVVLPASLASATVLTVR